jgi:hypothetical protein
LRYARKLLSVWRQTEKYRKKSAEVIVVLICNSARRAEFVDLRSSWFKIELMEQKQVISYQLELFDINGQGVVYPFLGREDVDGAQGIKDLQVNSAGKQERALVCNLMEVVIYTILHSITKH